MQEEYAKQEFAARSWNHRFVDSFPITQDMSTSRVQTEVSQISGKTATESAGVPPA